METCDCKKPTITKTKEYTVCSTCGIVLDKIYEDNVPFEKVSHFSNLIIGDIHPTINRTLSELSEKIIMTFETRMDIIERAYQLVNSTVNYNMATKYAFSEKFPDINIELTTKNIEKIETQEKKRKNFIVCGVHCFDVCSKSYKNKEILPRINKLKKILENGRKKGRKIDEILRHVKFSKTKYYKYRNITFTHIKKPTKQDLLSRSKKITPIISNHIISQQNKTLNELKSDILYLFNTDIHLTTIHYHRKKILSLDKK